MKQLFSAELKENVTREFFKKYLHDETDEKSIFYRYVVYMLYILSIKIFFHICVSKFKINKRQITGSIQFISSFFNCTRSSYIIIQSSDYVIIMSRTSFRVKPHSIVCLNVKELIARSRRPI